MTEIRHREECRRPRGAIVLQWNDEQPVVYRNLVLDIALRKIGDVLVGKATTDLALEKFGAGSGTTKVKRTDTGLEDEIGKISPPSTGYPMRDGNLLKIAWYVAAADLVGTWREVGIFFEDDVIWSRINVAEREKTDSDKVSIWYYCDIVS